MEGSAGKLQFFQCQDDGFDKIIGITELFEMSCVC